MAGTASLWQGVCSQMVVMTADLAAKICQHKSSHGMKPEFIKIEDEESFVADPVNEQDLSGLVIKS